MGLRFSGVALVSAGQVKTKDKDGKDLTQDQWKYPVYMAYMGGQVYAGATREAHEAIHRANSGGSKEGVDMMLGIEVSKFKEDTMIRVLSADVPGGQNPGVDPLARPPRPRV